MPYQRIRGFASDLRATTGNSARCLEFTILTAARTGEALMTEWSEIDLQERIWTIPACRMKGREQHVVYLSERAAQILKGQQGQHQRYVFPSPAGDGFVCGDFILSLTEPPVCTPRPWDCCDSVACTRDYIPNCMCLDKVESCSSNCERSSAFTQQRMASPGASSRAASVCAAIHACSSR